MDNRAIPRVRSIRLPAPLIPVAGVVIGGICLARYSNFSLWVYVLTAIIGLLGGWWLTGNRGSKDKHWSLLMICAGFAGVGGMSYELHYHYYPEGHLIRYCRPMESRLASIGGTIDTEPYIAKSRGSLARYDFLHEPMTIFTLRCDEVLTKQGWHDASGLVRVVVHQPGPHLKMGQRIRIDGWLSLYRGPRNPGQYDRTDSCRSARSLVSCRVPNLEAITVDGDGRDKAHYLAKVNAGLRKLAHAILFDTDSFAFDKESRGGGVPSFLTALLLGERHKLSPGIYESFMKTGTIHFLSVSGLHVGLLAGFVWGLSRLLRLSRRWAGLFCMVVLLVYLAIIPLRPPAMRAGLIAIVFCLAYMGRRWPNPLNILAFAAIVLLMVRPLDLFSAGFQLSFLVVLGLILFVPNLYRRIFVEDPVDLTTFRSPIRRKDDPFPWGQFLSSYVLRSLWGLTSVAGVAWLVGLPLTAWHFHRIALWGILGSVILYPLISLVALLGFSKLMVSCLLPFLSDFTAKPLVWLSGGVISITGILAELPCSSINTAAPPIWFIVIYYLILAGAGWYARNKDTIPRFLVELVLVWLIIFVWFIPFGERRRPLQTSAVTVLDAGHGNAVIVELPDDKVICYDAGSLSNFNLAGNIIIPFLRSRGIQDIDALFISHPNIDHYNGVVDLCRFFPVQTVYINEYFEVDIKSAAKFTLDKLQHIDQSVRFLSRGRRLDGKPEQGEGADYAIEILWPPRYHPSCELSGNDSSFVVRIKEENGSILLCGDIGEISQQLLLENSRRELRADVLLLPHHGSPSSLLPGFIQAVSPKISINSSGRISQAIRGKLTKMLPEGNVFHTCDHGAVTVRLKADGIETEPFR